MSKRLLTGLMIASLSLAFLSCDEEEQKQERQRTQEGDACTASKCISQQELMKCEDGIVVKQKCEDGYVCKNAACTLKPLPSTKCEIGTKPSCSKDGHYALTCNDSGLQDSEVCEFGCSNGACIKACDFTGTQCNSFNTAVTKCENGQIIQVEECPCNVGKCKEKCSTPGISCRGDIMVTCGTDGVETPTECPNGCDASTGACIERCEDGCTKNGALVKCENGQEVSKETCQYGCKDNKCLTKEEADSGESGGGESGGSGSSGGNIKVTCESDPDQCSLKGEVLCDESGNSLSTPKACEYGCYKGECRDVASAPACSGASDFCDPFGLILYRCVDGKQAQTPCEFGCSNGKCNDEAHAIGCTEGAAECSNGGMMIQECVDGKIVLNPCTNGCENGKCKVVSEDKVPCVNDTCYFGATSKLRKCVDGYYQDEICEGKCVFNAYGRGTLSCVPNEYCSEDGECKHLGKTKCDLEDDKYTCI